MSFFRCDLPNRLSEDEKAKRELVTKSQFSVFSKSLNTVGLISSSFQKLFVSHRLLPPNTEVGAIVELTFERNKEQYEQSIKNFHSLQSSILSTFEKVPESPVIRAREITQNSAIIEWDSLVLYNADLRSIQIKKDSEIIPDLDFSQHNGKVKIIDLKPDSEYNIWLTINTSTGNFDSNIIQIRTRKLDDLCGLNIYFGDMEQDILSELRDLVLRVEGRICDTVNLETTHYVSTKLGGKEYERALTLKIPAVTPGFLKACEMKRRIQPTESFELKELSSDK